MLAASAGTCGEIIINIKRIDISVLVMMVVIVAFVVVVLMAAVVVVAMSVGGVE